MAALVALICENPSNVSAQPKPDIRLVLQITIDGLRAGLINRYEKGFDKGGFRLLMAKGAYFTSAHHGFIPWMWPHHRRPSGNDPARFSPGIAARRSI
jgi:hypothetical protein